MQPDTPAPDRTPLDLDAIRDRLTAAFNTGNEGRIYDSLNDVPWLLDEVTALRELGRAALRESEAEVTALRAELDAAKANECTALCGDVEQERDELRAELDAALEDAKQAWFYLARSAEGIARQIERAAVASTPEWKQAGEAAIYVDAAAWAAAIARRHGAEGATDEQTT
jgi:hypothetical protein